MICLKTFLEKFILINNLLRRVVFQYSFNQGNSLQKEKK